MAEEAHCRAVTRNIFHCMEIMGPELRGEAWWIAWAMTSCRAGLSQQQRGTSGRSHLPYLLHHGSQSEVGPDHFHAHGSLNVGRQGLVVFCEQVLQSAGSR